ncbi:GTP-binding DUF697 domain-containing protein [Vibrio kyushuensis]|uniref:YcjF family protein n=1 Tax=Vibrio kyushuensis TaxID=2910249 RepID=UPI003D0A1347
MYESIKEFINPKKNSDLTEAHQLQRQSLPTLWLLGKTGAGKSSLIQALTGNTSVEVGNGFQPCTKTAQIYDFPLDKPIFRFLDTRGLAEAGYDPSDDLELFIHGDTSNSKLRKQGRALVVVIKIDEPEQSSLMSALKKVKHSRKIEKVLVVYTAVKQVSDSDRTRLIAFHKEKLAKACGKGIDSIEVDFELAPEPSNEGKSNYNVDRLIDRLAKLLPIIGLMVEESEHASVEEANFDKLENEILWYCGSVSASELIPAVGLVSVPAIQAKMLHSLANQYGVTWDKRAFAELTGTLGSSFGIQYGLKLGARQLTKLIPGYGQTIGAVTAAALSFGTTYGLGRAACYYFYHKSRNEPVSAEVMQGLYKEALDKGRKAKESSGETKNDE